MWWFPSAGVGVIAFANVTYGGDLLLVKATLDAFEALQRSGGLAPGRPAPAPALLEVQAEVNRLLSSWDDALARGLAAENFFLDTSLEKHRKQFGDLRAAHGNCKPEGPFETENSLRGAWRLRCERGRVRFFATVAPTGKLQQLDVTSALPADARLEAAVTGVLGLAAAWSDEKATRLLAPAVDGAATRKQLAALSALHGVCKAGDPVEGDGRTKVTVSLACEGRPLYATVELDEASGKVSAVRFGKPDGATCPD